MISQRISATLTVLLVAAIAVTISSSGVLSSVSSSHKIPAGGSLTAVQSTVNVGIFKDQTCTQNTSYVDWGSIKPGENATKTIWIKNLSNERATLSAAASDWSPPNAHPAINFSWDREGKILLSSEVVQATLTLAVSISVAENITDFNFNIQIIGSA